MDSTSLRNSLESKGIILPKDSGKKEPVYKKVNTGVSRSQRRSWFRRPSSRHYRKPHVYSCSLVAGVYSQRLNRKHRVVDPRETTKRLRVLASRRRRQKRDREG